MFQFESLTEFHSHQNSNVRKQPVSLQTLVCNNRIHFYSYIFVNRGIERKKLFIIYFCLISKILTLEYLNELGTDSGYYSDQAT